MNEIELKIIDIKPNEVRKRLKALGAKKVASLHYKRVVFPIKNTGTTWKWMRLRSDGKKHTLTLKISKGNKLSSTKEYEIGIDDFTATAKLLYNAFPESFYEENERELYSFQGAEITIDKWPEIPHYVEIEAKSEKEVERLYKKLGISGKRFGNVPATMVYRHYGVDSRKLARRNESKLAKLIKE